MNSDTVNPIPPRVFNKRRNEISVTPAIGESTSGGLISISRILKGLISIMKKPHGILPHVAVVRSPLGYLLKCPVRERAYLPIHDQLLLLLPGRCVQPQRRALQ